MSDALKLFGAKTPRLPFAEYVAAALIDLARQQGDQSVACPIHELPGKLKLRYNVEIAAEEIADAVEILSECNLAFVAKDPLAGTFVSISDGRFSALINSVASDKDRYQQALANVGEDPQAYYYAEEHTPTPSWDLLRSYKVIERYSEFGSPFVDAAMNRLNETDFAARLSQGSDRIVSFSDNQPIVDEIRSELQKIRTEVEFNNEVSAALGDSKAEALSEIDALSTAVSGTSSRAGYLLDLSKKILGWFGKLVANTSLSEVVKHVSKLFIDWLS